MTPIAAALSKHNFTTLVFDFRARGLSEGSACTLGFLEQWDVIGAVDFLTKHPLTRGLPIGVFGFSMGGAAAIFATARDERIRALGTEGTFAALETVIRRRTAFAAGPLAENITQSCKDLAACKGLLHMEDVRPDRVIGSIAPRPVFLITDGLDMTCPRSQSDALFEAAREPKQRWIASAAPHGGAFPIYREQCLMRVVDFFKNL
jgi:fermentation-respiration switch protein FrsA (DUF1100 family)